MVSAQLTVGYATNTCTYAQTPYERTQGRVYVRTNAIRARKDACFSQQKATFVYREGGLLNLLLSLLLHTRTGFGIYFGYGMQHSIESDENKGREMRKLEDEMGSKPDTLL